MKVMHIFSTNDNSLFDILIKDLLEWKWKIGILKHLDSNISWYTYGGSCLSTGRVWDLANGRPSSAPLPVPTPLLLSICPFGLLWHWLLLLFQTAERVRVAWLPLAFFAPPLLAVHAEALLGFQALEALLLMRTHKLSQLHRLHMLHWGRWRFF